MVKRNVIDPLDRAAQVVRLTTQPVEEASRRPCAICKRSDEMAQGQWSKYITCQRPSCMYARAKAKADEIAESTLRRVG